MRIFFPPAFPILVVSVGAGLGKTKRWLEGVVPELVRRGLSLVLSVPRHRLGEEIASALIKDGFSAVVYRGRDADDPMRPGKKMCQDLGRVKAIKDAAGDVARGACKREKVECKFHSVCGYQRQRLQKPTIWIVPPQLLFREIPTFIPRPDSLTIDESFWSASLEGIDKSHTVTLAEIRARRDVMCRVGSNIDCDKSKTEELMAISYRVCDALSIENSGHIRRAALQVAGVTTDMVHRAKLLELSRKRVLDVWPNQSIDEVHKITMAVSHHNKMVIRLSRFWDLLEQTIDSPDKCSPWLELRIEQRDSIASSVISMAWREAIHESWGAPTLIMDATTPREILSQFFPTDIAYAEAHAPMPHTWVRQIRDRAMTGSMLIPTTKANKLTNETRSNNGERIRSYLQVQAASLATGEILVVCQQGLEAALRAGALPATVKIGHFNAITGMNDWKDVSLVVVIGRTQPSPRGVEGIARVLFGSDVRAVEPDEKGEIRYPLVERGIRLRDGNGVPVMGPQHPDARVEAVRWAICEAELVQAIGRGRGVNRTAENSLRIDILTNVVLPIEVDEVTTWADIQPGFVDLMRAEGAILCNFPDMAKAYPDLFSSPEGARMAVRRELKNPEQISIGRKGGNPEQSPNDLYSIGICSGFSIQRYRRKGSRGPAGTLLYDAVRIDPAKWLEARLGEVVLISLDGPCPAASAPKRG